MQFKLLIDSIRGRAGEAVEIDPAEAETLAILRRNGIIAADTTVTDTVVSYDMTGKQFVETVKVQEPTITKVTEPEVTKPRRGRPPKDADAGNATN